MNFPAKVLITLFVSFVVMVFEQTVTKEARAEIRFVIREYQELVQLLSLIRKTDDSAVLATRLRGLRTLLVTLRGGFFGGEERVEYQVAKHFKTLTKLIEKQRFSLSSSLSPPVLKQVDDLLEKARVHEATLEVLGARGGEIEVTINQALKCNNDQECAHLMGSIANLIKKAITADQGLELCLKRLMTLVSAKNTTPLARAALN